MAYRAWRMPQRLSIECRELTFAQARMTPMRNTNVVKKMVI
jgi:hypothetical protein